MVDGLSGLLERLNISISTSRIHFANSISCKNVRVTHAFREWQIAHPFRGPKPWNIGGELCYAILELRPANPERKLTPLKVAAKLAAVLLLTWAIASPVMACLVPAVQLTPSEMACCRDMAGMCDAMGKTSSHTCCVKTKAGNSSFVIVPAQASFARPLQFALASIVAANNTAPLSAAPESILLQDGYPPGHSPPNLPELIAFRA